MRHWLDPLRETLDGTASPVTFFFRDDDAGWEDDRLRALLALFARHAIPLDLAVIPGALTAPLAEDLKWRSNDRLGVHQHGFGHINHEVSGRKCEFGPSRTAAQQAQDLLQGRRLLEERLDSSVDPIFTPPWNRCTQATADCLAMLGYRVLSRDATASRLRLNGVMELPVSVDWLRCKDGVWVSLADIGKLIAAATPFPVGVMLHHAVMDDAELQQLESLLLLLAGHSAARCVLMREAAGLAAEA